MDIYKRLAYLHQVQDLLNEMSESKTRENNKTTNSQVKKQVKEILPQSQDKKRKTKRSQSSQSSSDKSFTKLNSFYGHLSKEIAMKHNIQILNCDQMRQFRCKRCLCQYNFHQMTRSLISSTASEGPKMINLQGKGKKSGKFLKLICPQCGFQRKIIFHKQIKTKFERICAELEQSTIGKAQQPQTKQQQSRPANQAKAKKLANN